jgi:hypothetical protein
MILDNIVLAVRQDINGFKENEVKPDQAISIIQQEIELINKSLQIVKE